MSFLVTVYDVWWWLYFTPYGISRLEFHFAFMVDIDTSQLMSHAYLHYMGGLDALYHNHHPFHPSFMGQSILFHEDTLIS